MIGHSNMSFRVYFIIFNSNLMLACVLKFSVYFAIAQELFKRSKLDF